MEFRLQGIPFVAQEELKLTYKGEPLKQVYKPDFICYGSIIVELKAAKELASEHKGPGTELPESHWSESWPAGELRELSQGRDRTPCPQR